MTVTICTISEISTWKIKITTILVKSTNYCSFAGFSVIDPR